MLSAPGVTADTALDPLAVVGAHADDERAVAPILVRYAREAVQVRLLIASDEAAGCGAAGPHPATGCSSGR